MNTVTGFDPALHGFGFTNRFPGGAVVEALVRTDRLDEILGVEVPDALADLLHLVRGASFWGIFGLCGGMSWAALDLFHAGVPPPDRSSPPDPGSHLFGELVARQADSMGGRSMLRRCVQMQLRPDAAPWWFPWLRTLGSETAGREWPRLRAALDAGRPESLCLIRAKGAASPARNHQVVATGYATAGSDVRISIYDPNRPGQTPEIFLRAGRRTRPMLISQSTGEDLHGFFVQPWMPRSA